MTREERDILIERLAREADEGRQRIEAMRIKREENPYEYDLADRRLTLDQADLCFSAAVEPADETLSTVVNVKGPPADETLVTLPNVKAPPVEKSNGDGLLYRMGPENALAPAPQPEPMPPADGEAYPPLDQLHETIAMFVSEYVRHKLGERDTALNTLRAEVEALKAALREREERASAIAEVKRQYEGERVEHEALRLSSALSARDAKIEKLETQLQMLCKFLSLSGDHKLPEGL
jgi:DNA repair exonuclease SbcCD ATPase subunit